MKQALPLYLSEPALICACGRGRDALWQAVTQADNSAIRDCRTSDGSRSFPAAPVAETDLLPVAPGIAQDKTSRAFDPATKLVRMEQAALADLDGTLAAALNRYGPDRIAVLVGSCDNASETSLSGHRQFFQEGTFPAGYTLARQGAQAVSAAVRERYGLRGPAVSCASACSSSAAAVVKAAQLIRGGIADAVIVGGADLASDLVLLGFASMECISPVATNPFSRNRSGITLGEAAAFFLLAKDNFVTGRPAVTLAGYGESADAYHITSPDPSGTGAASAMRQALRSAGIGAQELGYINLHGTGTKLNDAMEARAVAAVTGGAVPCSATKSVTGHTLGAAGALSLAVCYETLVRNANAAGDTTVIATGNANASAAGNAGPAGAQEMPVGGADASAGGTGVPAAGSAETADGAGGSRKTPVILPAQAWDGEYDEELPRLNIIGKGNNRLSPRSGSLRYCMSNSFGFGGANVSIILQLEAGLA